MVFASHFHGDHFAPVIFDLAKDREDVNYVLSKDISKKEGAGQSDWQSNLCKGWEKLTLYTEGRKSRAGD